MQELVLGQYPVVWLCGCVAVCTTVAGARWTVVVICLQARKQLRLRHSGVKVGLGYLICRITRKINSVPSNQLVRMFSKAPVPAPRKKLNSCGGCSENSYETNNNEVKGEGSVDDNHDMSLSTLIISVERDIELLDQMEMKSVDSAGSAKLLSLPGYRPRDTSFPVRDFSYPATPPPLPRKTLRHRRHNSDSTINTSYDPEIEEDFPSTPSSPTDTFIADEVTKHMLRRPVTVFCPYCLAQFFHHQDLQEHLLHAHADELHALKEDRHHNLRPETCPCCQAEFLKVSIPCS